MDPAGREKEMIKREQGMRKKEIARLMGAKMMMPKVVILDQAKQLQKIEEGQKKQQDMLTKVEEEKIQKLKIIEQLTAKKLRQDEHSRIKKQKQEELRIKQEEKLMKIGDYSSERQAAGIYQAAEGPRSGNLILALQKKKKQEQGDLFSSSQEEENLQLKKQSFANQIKYQAIKQKVLHGLKNVVRQKRENYFEKQQKDNDNDPLIKKIKRCVDQFNLISQKQQLEKEKQLQMEKNSLQALCRQVEKNELKEQARAQERRKRLLMKQIREQLLEEQRKKQSLEGVKKEEGQEEKEQKSVNIPELLLCPITQIPMKSPMILTSCGHTFQEAAIRAWLRKNNKCPLCYKLADVTNLLKNFAMAAICMAHH